MVKKITVFQLVDEMSELANASLSGFSMAAEIAIITFSATESSYCGSRSLCIALHVSAPWRLIGDVGIMIGSSGSESLNVDGITDKVSYVSRAWDVISENIGAIRVVRIEVSVNLDLKVICEHNIVLEVFADRSGMQIAKEYWRYISGPDNPHYVAMSDGGITLVM